MTPRARVPVLLGVVACLATCGEPTAPRRGGRAALVLQPVIPANINLVTFGLTIDSARVVVTRGAETPYDETVFFPPDLAEIRLDVSISLRDERETLSVDLQLLSGRTPLFAGAQQVEVRAGAPPVPVIIPLTYVGDNAATLTVSPADSVVTFGGAAQFRASATDAAGNPVTQFYVAWSTDSAGLTLNAAGVFRAPSRRTMTTVIARTPAGVTGSTPVTVVPPPATLLQVSGDGQADTVGNAVPQPFVAQVRAADGLGVRGVPVDFLVLTGGGTVTAPRVVTDIGGFAQTTATLGPQTGTQTFQASVAGLPTTATFAVSATAAVASQLTFTGQPSATAAGTPITPAVVVTALDRFGNVAAGYAGTVTLALGANPTGATLSGTTMVGAVNAVATFSDLRLGQTGAGYTLVATATGLGGTTSNPFNVTLATGGIAWTNPAGGLWSNPGNWSAGRVPVNTDTVLITLDGTYTVTLDVDDTVAVLTLGGATGTQALLVSGRTFGVDSGGTIQANGALDLSSATLDGARTVTNAGTAVAFASTVNTAFANSGTLRVRASTSLNGALATGTSSTLRVEGDAFCCGAFLTVANGFTNNGTIELTAVNGTTGNTADLNVTSGRLVNAVGGVIDVLAGTGGARSLDVELDNQGTVTVGQALTMGRAISVHGNSGTIKVTGGDLTVNQSGGNPSFTNNPGGVIDIGAGRTMKVNGFTVTNAGGGTILGSGTLDVATTTFTNLGDVNPGTSPGILTVTGSVTHGSGGRVNIEIGGPAPGVEHDQLRVSGLAQLDATLGVVLIGGFRATSGQGFVIMTYGTLTGSFISPSLPPGFIMDYTKPGEVIARCQLAVC